MSRLILFLLALALFFLEADWTPKKPGDYFNKAHSAAYEHSCPAEDKLLRKTSQEKVNILDQEIKKLKKNIQALPKKESHIFLKSLKGQLQACEGRKSFYERAAQKAKPQKPDEKKQENKSSSTSNNNKNNKCPVKTSGDIEKVLKNLERGIGNLEKEAREIHEETIRLQPSQKTLREQKSKEKEVLEKQLLDCQKLQDEYEDKQKDTQSCSEEYKNLKDSFPDFQQGLLQVFPRDELFFQL